MSNDPRHEENEHKTSSVLIFVLSRYSCLSMFVNYENGVENRDDTLSIVYFSFNFFFILFTS